MVPALNAFQVVADPSRREMLRLLLSDSMTINGLAEHFEMSRPAVSKHVRILNEAGFISIQDKGRERHCTLKHDGFNELQQWIDHFNKFWDNKLNKLEKLLSQKSKK